MLQNVFQMLLDGSEVLGESLMLPDVQRCAWDTLGCSGMLWDALRYFRMLQEAPGWAWALRRISRTLLEAFGMLPDAQRCLKDAPG